MNKISTNNRDYTNAKPCKSDSGLSKRLPWSFAFAMVPFIPDIIEKIGDFFTKWLRMGMLCV